MPKKQKTTASPRWPDAISFVWRYPAGEDPTVGDVLACQPCEYVTMRRKGYGTANGHAGFLVGAVLEDARRALAARGEGTPLMRLSEETAEALETAGEGSLVLASLSCIHALAKQDAFAALVAGIALGAKMEARRLGPHAEDACKGQEHQANRARLARRQVQKNHDAVFQRLAEQCSQEGVPLGSLPEEIAARWAKEEPETKYETLLRRVRKRLPRFAPGSKVGNTPA